MSAIPMCLSPPPNVAVDPPHNLYTATRGFRSYSPGENFVFKGVVVRVASFESLDVANAVYIATGASIRVNVCDLEPLRDSRSSEEKAEPPIVANSRIDPDGKKYKKISRWVRRLCRNGNRIPNKTVKKVATRLETSQTTFRKILSRYRETGNVVLQFKRGRKRHHRYLGPTRELLLKEAIKAVSEKHRGCPISAVVRFLEPRCLERKLDVPCRNTIAARIGALLKSQIAKANGHEDQIKATRLIKGRFDIEEALGVIQVDFTVADFFVVHPDTREVIGRPLLGLVIDMATRVILGAWLFLEAPNHFTAGWMIAHAVMPKAQILAKLGLAEFAWPCYGKPNKVFVDGGFRIAAFIDACERRQIDVAFRDPGECQQGGMIERAIGTFVGRLHLLNGTTWSNPIVRRKGKIDPGDTACYTPREGMQYLLTEVHRYLHTKHGGVDNRFPIDLWEASFRSGGVIQPPVIPVDLQTFFLPFLWNKVCTVHREGVYVERNWYRAPELAPHVGMRYRTYYNKTFPSLVYPEIKPDEFLRIPIEDGAGDRIDTCWTDRFSRLNAAPSPNLFAHLQARAKVQTFQERLESQAVAKTDAARKGGAVATTENIASSSMSTYDALWSASFTERLED